ncbi:hypothetical protein [Brevundimonas diminuta]|uniref:hypothetical protein n=1 Tax=Brevundimonas diminuta TaxID=293 RepID=UPI003F7EF81B
MTTPRVTVPVEDLLFCKLKDLILEQSEGEWTDEMIVRDAHHFANHIRPLLSAAPAPDAGAVSIWSDARNVFVRYAELFAMTERYEEASAIADKAAREIEALATREEAPAEAGEAMTEAEVRQWIDACNHEPARQVLRDYLALRAQPPAREDAQPVACVSCEDRPASGNNPCASCGRTHPAPDALRVAVEALEKASRAISAQYALAQAEYQHLDTVASKHDKIVQEGRRAIREALAALQAEQKGGA